MDRSTARPSGPSSVESRGVICPDELYTINELKHRLGVTNSTLRAARRGGLLVYYLHKHAYVFGREWIEYVIHSHAEKSTEGAD